MKKKETSKTLPASHGASFFWPLIEVGMIDPLRMGVVQ